MIIRYVSLPQRQVDLAVWRLASTADVISSINLFEFSVMVSGVLSCEVICMLSRSDFVACYLLV